MTRKLIDVEKIFAVLDAEKHLVHGNLVARIPLNDSQVEMKSYLKSVQSDAVPEPGPLAVANCDHIGRCAMGSLLYATGRISYHYLAGMDAESRYWELEPVKALYDTYGLQRYHASEIICANDEADGDDERSIAQRRERVKQCVRDLAQSQISEPEADLDECQMSEAEGAILDPKRPNFDALDLDYVGWANAGNDPFPDAG